MRIRAAAAAVLLAVTVTACSSDGEAAPAVTVPSTTSIAAEATTTPLSVSWVRRLQVLAVHSCRTEPFASACMTGAAELQASVLELGSEAAQRGDAIVKRVAVQVAAELQEYGDDCITSKPGSLERSRCLALSLRLPNAHEDLIAAINQSEGK